MMMMLLIVATQTTLQGNSWDVERLEAHTTKMLTPADERRHRLIHNYDQCLTVHTSGPKHSNG